MKHSNLHRMLASILMLLALNVRAQNFSAVIMPAPERLP